jgi:hypothetical protein
LKISEVILPVPYYRAVPNGQRYRALEDLLSGIDDVGAAAGSTSSCDGT